MNSEMCTLHFGKRHLLPYWEMLMLITSVLMSFRRDVMSVKENVCSLTQKVDNMGQTVSSYEKNLDPVNQELTQVKGDLLSLRTKVSDFIDLCQQVGCFEPQGCGSADDSKVSMQRDIVLKLDMLKKSLCGLEDQMTCIETQCMQFDARTSKMDDNVCCNACVRVADSMSMNTRNVNALYNALLSKGLLTEKMGENLITNFQNGWQVVGPLFSTPALMPKGKNGVISFASPLGNHSRSTLMSSTKNIGDLKVDETLNETNDMGVNRKVYEEQLKLIPVFNGKDTLKFQWWIKSIEKSVNSGFYNPHRICHMKAEGTIESFISKHLHEDWNSLKVKLRTHFSDLCTTQDCVKAVHGCKQGTCPMTSYIDKFEELIAGMDGSQSYIQNFVDGLRDLRLKNIILVRWNEGSIRTISEAFDLAMEKETTYSNLVGSGDELLLMASTGVQDDFVQRISSMVCENMKNECVREYDLNGKHDPILTNFLKNCQYGGQGNFPSGNNTHFNDDYKGHKAYNEANHGPSGGNQWNGFYNNGQYWSAPW